MLAQGEWMIGRPVPNHYGKEVQELLEEMMAPEAAKRPTISEARVKMTALK